MQVKELQRLPGHTAHATLMTYNEDPDRNVRLAGHGFKMLADAIEADLPYAPVPGYAHLW